MARVISVRLSDDLLSRLDELAASFDRPRAWVIEQAIARYVEEAAWQVAAVTEALAECRRGGVVLHSHDDVMERLAAKFSATTHDADPPA